MKVLLILKDLFANVGGGQVVYRRLIAAHPQHDFYYFVERESRNAARPDNVTPIPLASARRLRPLNPLCPGFRKATLELVDQFARSVADQQFDVVDCPDFYAFGTLLRSALNHHRVKVGRFVVAMHGNISKSIELAWGSAGDNTRHVRELEIEQFQTADGVYAISPRYMAEWGQIHQRPIHFIDPLHFVDFRQPEAPQVDLLCEPVLACIGRSERRKGNDIFIDLYRNLNRQNVGGALHIGDCDYSMNGVASSYILEQMAIARGVQIPYRKSMDHRELRRLYEQSTIVVLPVRYDTLNLVALESIFAGAPLVLSDGAGAADYLRDYHPDVPFVRLALNNLYGGIRELQNLCDDFASHKLALFQALRDHPPRPMTSCSLGPVYQSAGERGHSFSSSLDEYQSFNVRKSVQARRFVSKLLPQGALQSIRKAVNVTRHPLRWISQDRFERQLVRVSDLRVANLIRESVSFPNRFERIAELPEQNADALREKLHLMYALGSGPLFRCNFWSQIARVERLRGNDLLAAAYEMRVLRLMGSDRLGLLGPATATLEHHGLHAEAGAVRAMIAGDAAVAAFLSEREAQCRALPAASFELMDDQRRPESPRVSVIVSLYNAADKLRLFLELLANQTLVRKGEVEVILVDSGSPGAELEVFKQFQRARPLSVVYARTRDRETIQAAWNRGISLARAKYLSFLGVDEALYPEALEVLADRLDQSGADWAMANSLVTAVDENGCFKHDIMAYDRKGATKEHAFLETCFVSWVGGLYRADIHDRFGYYDETFRGAGDTEFKSRVLPRLRVEFVDQTLGVFLNYPDGQTTASPRAEIEDSRAWYVHRTPAGIAHAFEASSDEASMGVLKLALGYRKSYCRHLSSDIEYASNLATVLRRRSAHLCEDWLVTDLDRMLQCLRKLEWTEGRVTPTGCAKRVLSAWASFQEFQRKHAVAFGDSATVSYSVLNDNRYEQHSWLWKS